MTRRIDVRILTPFGAASGMGNWRTATRYAQMLRSSGLNASVYEPSRIDDACLNSGQRIVAIVLNAARSAEQLHAFVQADIPVMLVMTGTDLYGVLRQEKSDTAEYRSAEAAMQAATKIVALQQEAAQEISDRWPQLADRVSVLLQTSPLRRPFAPLVTSQSKTVRFLIAAHIREEKDPRTGFLGFHKAFPEGWAKRADGRRVPVRLLHVGGYRDKALMQELILMSTQYPGILLEGPLTHAETMRMMTHVHCLIQPSVSEGGALVVSEAVACRLPVIASNIPAHRSQLGADYPGLFQVGDADHLAESLTRFVGDQKFIDALRQSQAHLMASLASTSQEREGLVALIRNLAEHVSKEIA